MKLTEAQRKVLSTAQLTANASIADIARGAGMREHVARAALERLQDNQALTAFPVINLYPLGLVEYDIYFSFNDCSQAHRDGFFSSLVNSGRVCWVQAVAGEYEYGFGIAATSPQQASELLDGMSESWGGVFRKRSIITCLRYFLFSSKYLAPSMNSDWRFFEVGPRQGLVKIDEVDRKILDFLANEAITKTSQMARSMGIPASTLEYHLKSLQEKEVLLGFAYSLDLSLFGVQSYRILIQFSGISTQRRQQFREFCQDNPNITVYIDYLGEWDVGLRAEAEHFDEVGKLVEGLRRNFPREVAATSILPILQNNKIIRFRGVLNSQQ